MQSNVKAEVPNVTTILGFKSFFLKLKYNLILRVGRGDNLKIVFYTEISLITLYLKQGRDVCIYLFKHAEDFAVV